MQTIKPIKPVGELTVEIVREINAVSKALGLELLLVGAQAKVILLENIHGLNPGRATGDIDFAFAVESWDQFNQIKQSLIATGKFRELPKVKQRLLYQSSLIEHGFVVDIIPFGKMQDDNNMIAWPPELDVVISVSGYQEALESALLVELNANLTIKVVSLAGLAVLKIFAWSERGTVTENKDAIDLLTLLRTYHEAGNADRIYEVLEPEVLESLDYNPELMGAWLLGYDAAAIAYKSTIERMTELIESKKENLILQMAKSLTGNENALNEAEALLKSFTNGLRN
ncbi:MAG: nucleotidyl transferase AbiEii/AbiGii toxin family protein [Methylotenera sp.]|uniref:nucleotidyl transferase AbiEii/AbiGii toxin family protein n=1 Tax=Methylotenera sp. TaxID=2051956 RepID=UPI0024889E92|nr:nucleotidyl transferase AbiEii/AbiGii toxin family protein [Methylotenera sp.]MDI1309997.1 nucleotidyl transferase AbiEii/AbiGii toxin family protein [Methylotenera sp.]